MVIGDDRLTSRLEQFAKSQPQQPAVIKVAKSGGVITRSTSSRAAGHASRVREYFYGISNELSPTSNVLDISAVQVDAPWLPTSVQPTFRVGLFKLFQLSCSEG